MLKVYHCPQCNSVFYLSRKTDTRCRSCSYPLNLLKIDFCEYTNMSKQEREEYIEMQLK